MHELLQDKTEKKPWSKMQDVFIADYCQNMECPYFDLSQPGDTYYFSCISVFCFGISNVGIKDHPLRAYIYLEGEGKKGGNNVASLLMKHLNETGCVDKAKGPRNELTIIMDNCGNQNKNQMVIQLAPLLGHTKNSSNHLFNVMKMKYRKSDIFSAEILVKTISKCNLVDAI